MCRLLRAIPAGFVPERQPLTATETPAELRDGIAASATRIYAAARWRPEMVPWTPALTAESWRWTANAIAVACDITGAMLTALARRARPGGDLPVAARLPLALAHQAAAQACASWQHVTASWKYLTSETRGLAAPGVADTGDLVIRLGRLAFADPHWTPPAPAAHACATPPVSPPAPTRQQRSWPPSTTPLTP